MKKLFFLVSAIILIFSTNVFASVTKMSIQNISENQILVNVSSDSKIQVTGYTVNDGSNILVYYLQDDSGSFSDFIRIDTNTVLRPYRIKLVNANDNPFKEPFEDMQEHKMKDYIRHLYDLGYIDGYREDNTFRADNNITRAEMFTLMVRLLDLNENAPIEKSFDDLDSDHWAYSDVMKAVNNGLIDGYSENGKVLLKLNNNITIAEASKLIHDSFSIETQNKLNYDVRFVNHWSKNYIQNLLNNNIISPNDEFYKNGDIDRPITRGEVAMLISRALGR